MGFKSLEIWKKYAKNGELIPMLFFKFGGNHMVSDEYQIRHQYKAVTGKKLNLDNPKSFNEKIQWLKLHDRNPLYCTMVDKYEVKNYVAGIIGEEYIIPTLGVWDTFDEIDFDSLPQQFVLKCTHDSGGIVIVKDKATMNLASAREKIEKSLKNNYYYVGREWPYKDVKPRIIAEKYMSDSSESGIDDYKIFNFDGEPAFIEVDYDRFVDHKRNLYSIDWEYINASIQFPNDAKHQISKPVVLEEMLDVARKLSNGFVHMRTDFYCIDDHVYFGEITLFHGSGFEKFTPEEFGVTMGEYLKLPSGGV